MDTPYRTRIDGLITPKEGAEKLGVSIAIIPWEFKNKASLDPFTKIVNGQDLGEDEQRVLGQLYGYVSGVDDCQYRTHVFQLFTCGRSVRILKWDHSACLFSEAFDYTENSGSAYLAEFLYRFSRLSEPDRGYDTRFTVLDEQHPDAQRAKAPLTPWLKGTDKFRRFFTFTVKDGKSQHELVAWHHLIRRDSMIGRCTRAFPVFNLGTGEVNFYKDSWSPIRDIYTNDVETEAAILRTLNGKDVRNIPTLLCGGVVELDGPIVTANADSADKEWNKGKTRGYSELVVKRRLTFTLVREVGHSLESFESTRELMKVVGDAFLGDYSSTFLNLFGLKEPYSQVTRTPLRTAATYIAM
jgi:hypothetical protein